MAILVQDLVIGTYLVVTAIFFDTWDGMAARALNAQSELGKELDSLSDIVSFGVAPAYLYFMISSGEGYLSYAAAIILLSGCALRLGKFNILPSQKDFIGLATPAMAFFIVGVVLAYANDISFFQDIINSKYGHILIAITMFVLMLSPIRMFSLKRLNEGIQKNWMPAVCLSSFLALWYFAEFWAIPVSVIIYMALSILHHFNVSNTQ